MRKAAVAAILSAAVATGIGLLSPSPPPPQPPKPQGTITSIPAATRPTRLRPPPPVPLSAQPAKADAGAANEQTQVPVKQVVLYSSGVGYFEHYGTMKGNGTTELRFKTAQINDILKSLVLQDMDKGRVGVITYPSQDPIAKTLRSFQVDITSNPTLADLLNQLRGAKVTLASGAEKVTGTVLGVERKSRPLGEGAGVRVVEVPFLNLI